MARKIRKVVDYHKTLYKGSGSPSPIDLVGYQVTDSSPHPQWREHIAWGRDVGGTFYSYRPTFRVHRGWSGYAPAKGIGSTSYEGTLLAENPANKFEGASNHYFNTTDRNTMIVKGTTAIARVTPTNPLADATVTLGEMRAGGIPMLPGMDLLKSKAKDPRKIGSEYLNIEFGIKPLISDVQKFSKSVIESEKILEQLRRDSGRRIRRRYTFPTETTSSSTSVTGNVYPYPIMSTANYLGGNSWTKKTTTTVEKRFWFSGCFTYHYPSGDTALEEMQRFSTEAKRLYGVRLSPEVIWNLSPWSWAADWIGNIGDNITNLSNLTSDGLVMPYGYIMYQKTTTVFVELTGPGTNDGKGKYFAQSYTHVDKMRVRATPFGFGLNTDLFTNRQWSIIGALGIANAPGRRVF